MQIRCIAIDDEPLALELIMEYCARMPAVKLIRTFEDAISGAEFLRDASVDLIFVDINMPDITGIDLVKSLKEKPMVIFTTAHKKFAIDGFDLEAVDYLLKPISFERFERAASRAIEYAAYKKMPAPAQPGVLFVRSEYRLVKIDFSAIDYLESLEDYVKIHLDDGKSVMTLSTLKSILDKLPATDFKRIHRSYLVHLNRISSIVNRKVQLKSGVELPVSESYAGFLNEWRNQ